MTLVEDIANKLADMTTQDLPVYKFLFPIDVTNCVCIFPLMGMPTEFFSQSSSTTTMGVLDKPGIQIQVRYSNPSDAYAKAENIRQWLDQNPPTGYVLTLTTRSQPSNVTSPEDINMINGPAYRYSVDFIMSKVR